LGFFNRQKKECTKTSKGQNQKRNLSIEEVFQKRKINRTQLFIQLLTRRASPKKKKANRGRIKKLIRSKLSKDIIIEVLVNFNYLFIFGSSPLGYM